MSDNLQQPDSIARQLLAVACVLESLPSVKQKGEYVEHALKTVLGLKDAVLCLKACGGKSGGLPECGVCNLQNVFSEGQPVCPLSNDDRFRVIHVGTNMCPCVLALPNTDDRTSRVPDDLLSNFLVMLAVSINKKLAEKKLQESESRLSATLYSIGDGVITTDNAGNVASLNEVAERLTGWTAPEVAGKPVDEIFHIINTHTRKKAVNPMTRAMKEGVIVGLANDTVLIARDGTEYQIADSCAPVKDTNGKVIGAVLVFRDVTEDYKRRELERFEIRFQKIISEILSRFAVMTSISIDQAIDRSLSELGGLFNADRSYLFRFSDDLILMDNTHEWCAPDVKSQKKALQKMRTDAFPWWLLSLRSLRPINIPDVEKMPPEAAAEQKILKKQKIQSLLVLPVFNNSGNLSGFIGMDLVRTQRVWTGDEIRMLRVATEIISGAILKDKMRSEIAARIDELERWRNVMLDREDRVIELKREVNEACRRSGAPIPYASV